MIPPVIVEAALERGINLIAITDHNASANVAAVQKAAQDRDLVVLPGMELQTREEVHLLCLFDTLQQLETWQRVVDRKLPILENHPGYFGEQFVVDESGKFLRRDHQLRLTSAWISVEDAFAGVNKLDGLVIPAHVDRKAFGLIANLGFLPPGLTADAMEISRNIQPQEARACYPQLGNYPLIQSGDVHRRDEFLGLNAFRMAAATIAEMKAAFRGVAGRSLEIRQQC